MIGWRIEDVNAAFWTIVGAALTGAAILTLVNL